MYVLYLSWGVESSVCEICDSDHSGGCMCVTVAVSESCVWQQWVTAVCDSSVWQQCVTAVCDSCVWQLCVTDVCVSSVWQWQWQCVTAVCDSSVWQWQWQWVTAVCDSSVWQMCVTVTVAVSDSAVLCVSVCVQPLSVSSIPLSLRGRHEGSGTLHYTTALHHCTTRHYTTLHYTTLHYTTLYKKYRSTPDTWFQTQKLDVYILLEDQGASYPSLLATSLPRVFGPRQHKRIRRQLVGVVGWVGVVRAPHNSSEVYIVRYIGNL